MEHPSELIGWASSFILCLTISRQVYIQWREKTSKGVSKWLYIGQFASEIGFVAYSWIVANWVFVFTNAFLLFANTLGLLLVLRHRRMGRAAD